MIKFILLYFTITFFGLGLSILGVTNGLEQQLSLSLAQLSGAIIHLFDNYITLNQAVLRHGTSGFALEITTACNALNLSWFSIVAFGVIPTHWKMRVLGAFAILFIVQTANIARIITLFYLGEMISTETFTFIHEQLFVLVFHLLVIILFFIWLQWLFLHKMLHYDDVK